MEEQKKYENKILTIPNIITIIRMIGSIYLLSYIYKNGIDNHYFVTTFALVLALSDLLDGFIARRYNMYSHLGGALDPIADKLLNWGIGLVLMVKGIMPLWPLVIAIRDVIVFLFTSYLFLCKKIELKPTMPAKLKMCFQSAGVIATLLFGFGKEKLLLIAPIFMGLSILMIVIEPYYIYQSLKKKRY